MLNVSGRSDVLMYQLKISNQNLTTTETIEDYKGVMFLIKVFEKRYGQPDFIQVLLLKNNLKEVDSN